MGYSKSIVTLERRLRLLTPLINGKECMWECDLENERTLAYQIREALHIAKTIGAEDYPNLAKAAREFSISETGEGRIIAKRIVHDARTIDTSFINDEVIRDRLSGEGNLKVSENLTLIQVLSHIKNTPRERLPFHFPTTILSKEELLTLHKWLTQNTDYLMFWSEPGITIKEYSEELETLAFSEDDLEENPTGE